MTPPAAPRTMAIRVGVINRLLDPLSLLETPG